MAAGIQRVIRIGTLAVAVCRPHRKAADLLFDGPCGHIHCICSAYTEGPVALPFKMLIFMTKPVLERMVPVESLATAW